jgi:hypothetical protein
MFVVIAGVLEGEPGTSKIIVDAAGGKLPAAFTATAVVGIRPTFFEAFDLAADGALTANALKPSSPP